MRSAGYQGIHQWAVAPSSSAGGAAPDGPMSTALPGGQYYNPRASSAHMAPSSPAPPPAPFPVNSQAIAPQPIRPTAMNPWSAFLSGRAPTPVLMPRAPAPTPLPVPQSIVPGATSPGTTTSSSPAPQAIGRRYLPPSEMPGYDGSHLHRYIPPSEMPGYNEPPISRYRPPEPRTSPNTRTSPGRRFYYPPEIVAEPWWVKQDWVRARMGRPR